MGYSIFQFNLGTGEAQAYVLRGEGEHEGTNETISFHDMMHYATDGRALAEYLDRRFLRADGERRQKESAMRAIGEFARECGRKLLPGKPGKPVPKPL